MLAYEVTAEVNADLVDRYVAYMRDTHVPDVLATGCFAGAEFAQAGATSFRTRYLAATPAHVDRYLAQFTHALRGDFVAHFPAGVTLVRATWTVIERWPA